MRRRTVGALLVWALPLPLSAQLILHGRVEDAVSGEPIQGALILTADSTAGTLTDSMGVFAIPVGRVAPFMLLAEQFGYEPTVFELSETAPNQLSVLQLPPMAIEIEGVTVVGETQLAELNSRLEGRRRGYPGVSRTLDAEAISRVAAGDAFDLLLRQIPGLFDCETASYPGLWTDYLCRRPRGPMLPGGAGLEEFLICIDGVASFLPGSDLRSVPVEEIAAFEFYGEAALGTSARQRGIENIPGSDPVDLSAGTASPSGIDGIDIAASRLTPTVGQARIYTHQWMARNAGRPRPLLPVQFGC